MKYFSIEDFRCQLVTEIKPHKEGYVVRVLHPNDKNVLKEEVVPNSSIVGDPVEFLTQRGAIMKSGININDGDGVKTELQVHKSKSNQRRYRIRNKTKGS